MANGLIADRKLMCQEGFNIGIHVRKENLDMLLSPPGESRGLVQEKHPRVFLPHA